MRRYRLRPAYKVFLGYAIFCCSLLAGQLAIFWRVSVVRERSIADIRTDFMSYTNVLSLSVEAFFSNSVPMSVSGEVVEDYVPPPRVLGCAYSRGTRYIYPYADVEYNGEVTRHYFRELPIAATSVWSTVKQVIVDTFGTE